MFRMPKAMPVNSKRLDSVVMAVLGSLVSHLEVYLGEDLAAGYTLAVMSIMLEMGQVSSTMVVLRWP